VSDRTVGPNRGFQAAEPANAGALGQQPRELSHQDGDQNQQNQRHHSKGRRGTLDCIYRACMSRSASDQDAEAQRSAALRQDEMALVHEVFAEEHESAAESLSGDLAEAHRGAADKHLQAADEDRRQAQTAREEADADHD
jgi:hypothetical protein